MSQPRPADDNTDLLNWANSLKDESDNHQSLIDWAKSLTPSKSSSKLDVPATVDDELSNLGYTPQARQSLLGNLGRENNWNPDTIFEGHTDPKNGAFNRGLMSWQGVRLPQLEKYITKNGGDWTPNEKNLRLQTQFMDKELKSNYPDVYQALQNPDTPLPKVSRALRNYIGYVPTAPYNTPDSQYDTKNNRIWAQKALKQGLAQTPANINEDDVWNNVDDLLAKHIPKMDEKSTWDTVDSLLADNKGGQPISPTVATLQTISVPLLQETNLVQPNIITPPVATAPPVTSQVPVTTPQVARQPVLPRGVGSRPVIGQDIPEDAVVTKDGGYVQFPRVAGKESDNLNATAGVYTPPATETSPETALRNALLSAGDSRGLTPQMADKFIADTKAQYGSVMKDPIFKKWKPGSQIVVTFNNLVQAGLNPEDVKLQNRQEQVQNPVNVPNLSLPETHINPIKDAADWMNKNADPITANLASVLAGGAGTYNTYMAGVLRTINDLSPTKGVSMAEAPGSKQTSENDLTRFADYLQKVGTAGQEFQEETGAQGETAQTLKGIGAGLAGLPRLVMLPGGPIVNFAVDQAAMTRGAGGSSMDELKAGFEGAGLGALSEFVGPFVGKLAGKVSPLLKPVAELATVGGGTYTLSKLADDKSPIANTAVMTVFHTLGMIGKARVQGKIFEAQDGDGNDIKMQVQGDKIVQVVDEAKPDIKIAIPKFQSTEGKDVISQADKLKAATVSPEDLQKTIDEAKNVTTNASGESAASQEAINRQASEQAKGLTRVVVDTRPKADGTYNERPLIPNADAVDYKPQPYESVEFRGGDRNGEVIAQGDKVNPAYSPPERGIQNVGENAIMQSEGATNTPEPKPSSSVKETNVPETSLPKEEPKGQPEAAAKSEAAKSVFKDIDALSDLSKKEQKVRLMELKDKHPDFERARAINGRMKDIVKRLEDAGKLEKVCP